MNMTAAAHERERDRSYWERHARKYDLSLRLLARPMPGMLALTAAAVRGASDVLDVAAGTGLVTQALARSATHVVATDYAQAMVEMLRARIEEQHLDNVTCRQADLYELPFEPSRFDAVVAANVLHLLPDLDGALTSLRGVLRGDGRLIVPTFCHDETRLSAVVSRVLAVTGFPGQRRFTSSSLCLQLERRGVRITKHELLPGLIPIAYVEGTFAR